MARVQKLVNVSVKEQFMKDLASYVLLILTF
jgi:hypothetical protein